MPLYQLNYIPSDSALFGIELPNTNNIKLQMLEYPAIKLIFTNTPENLFYLQTLEKDADLKGLFNVSYNQDGFLILEVKASIKDNSLSKMATYIENIITEIKNEQDIHYVRDKSQIACDELEKYKNNLLNYVDTLENFSFTEVEILAPQNYEAPCLQLKIDISPLFSQQAWFLELHNHFGFNSINHISFYDSDYMTYIITGRRSVLYAIEIIKKWQNKNVLSTFSLDELFQYSAKIKAYIQTIKPQQLPVRTKNINEFTYVKDIDIQSAHKVCLYTMSGKNYYVKFHIGGRKNSEYEAAISLRNKLMLGKNTPDVLCVVDEEGERIATASEEIPGFISFFDAANEYLNNKGIIPTTEELIAGGLADVTVSSHIHNENDGHTGNLGLDKQKSVAKIDNDQENWKISAKYAGISDRDTVDVKLSTNTIKNVKPAEAFPITVNDIRNLPYLSDAMPYNLISREKDIMAIYKLQEIHKHPKFIERKFKQYLKHILIDRQIDVAIAECTIGSKKGQDIFISSMEDVTQQLRRELLTMDDFYDCILAHPEFKLQIIGELKEYNQLYAVEYPKLSIDLEKIKAEYQRIIKHALIIKSLQMDVRELFNILRSLDGCSAKAINSFQQKIKYLDEKLNSMCQPNGDLCYLGKPEEVLRILLSQANITIYDYLKFEILIDKFHNVDNQSLNVFQSIKELCIENGLQDKIPSGAIVLSKYEDNLKLLQGKNAMNRILSRFVDSLNKLKCHDKQFLKLISAFVQLNNLFLELISTGLNSGMSVQDIDKNLITQLIKGATELALELSKPKGSLNDINSAIEHYIASTEQIISQAKKPVSGNGLNLRKAYEAAFIIIRNQVLPEVNQYRHNIFNKYLDEILRHLNNLIQDIQPIKKHSIEFFFSNHSTLSGNSKNFHHSEIRAKYNILSVCKEITKIKQSRNFDMDNIKYAISKALAITNQVKLVQSLAEKANETQYTLQQCQLQFAANLTTISPKCC